LFPGDRKRKDQDVALYVPFKNTKSVSTGMAAPQYSIALTVVETLFLILKI
jgi:hypothetical protein